MEKFPTITLVVALALGDSESRWLMHQRPVGKHHGGLWEFPGGKVEAGESLVFAMIREAKEELGIALRAADLTPVGFVEAADSRGGQGLVILLYTATTWQGVPEALEGGAVRWCQPREIAKLDLAPLDRELLRQLFRESAQ